MSEELDLSDFDTVDEDVMTVKTKDGTETTWTWTFAGPGHPKTVEQSNRLAKERLRREKAQEQAVVNGKKWKAEDETPDEALDRNVKLVTDRLLGWSPINLNGTPFPYTVENANLILKDRRKGHILIQALEFLGDEVAFSGRSATTSEPSPSDHSSSTGTKKAAPAGTA
ncbi:branched-chain amino acid ABC transporter [Aquamicrobium terrae]